MKHEPADSQTTARRPWVVSDFEQQVYGPHPVTGTLKDSWKWWRIVVRSPYAREERQVSNDGEIWEACK